MKIYTTCRAEGICESLHTLQGRGHGWKSTYTAGQRACVKVYTMQMSKQVQEMWHVGSILCTVLLFEFLNLDLLWPPSPFLLHSPSFCYYTYTCGQCFVPGRKNLEPLQRCQPISHIYWNHQQLSVCNLRVAKSLSQGKTQRPHRITWKPVLRWCPAFHWRGPFNLFGPFEHFTVSFKKCFYVFDCLMVTLYFGQ